MGSLSIEELYVKAQGHLRLGEFSHVRLCAEFILRFSPAHQGAMHLLGESLCRLHLYSAACDVNERCLNRYPGDPLATINQVNALQGLGRKVEAEQLGRQLLAARPDDARVQCALGILFSKLGYYEEALMAANKAVELAPQVADNHNNLGVLLQAACRFPEAIAAFHASWQCRPDFLSARLHEGMLQLLLGHWLIGWDLYEYRLGLERGALMRNSTRPKWDGSASLLGKVILLYAEQGLGDSIQFVRFTVFLQERGARVVLVVQPSLHRLLERASLPGVEQILGPGDAYPEHDVQASLLSLGALLKLQPPQFLPKPAYLCPKGRSAAAVQPPRRIGLCWSGNPDHVNDSNRSLSLRELEPLFSLAGCEIVLVQKQACAEVEELTARYESVRNPGIHFRDFSETAECLLSLDLLISVDTSLCHLGGALGVPTWTLLSWSPDWRWGLEDDSTPWYPTMTLFRQPKRGDWASVVAKLTERLGACRRPLSIHP